jgi:two-component system NarL family sensor kinase
VRPRRILCIDAFRSGELTAGNINIIECSRLRAALGERRTTRNLRYHASIPLYFGGRPLGIMNVATAAWRKLTRRELDLLSTIASQVGVAIERARLADASVGLARIEERARFARDLHDTLTQGLTAIGLHVEAALAHLSPPESAAARPSAARAELDRALSVTRANLVEARRSLRELRTSPLEGRPLSEALTALGRQVTADAGLRVQVRPTIAGDLDANLEETLFRIAGEALANIRRHASAYSVDIVLTATRRRVRLTVADDGRGFDVRKRGNGLGIEGMRERARLAGGSLVITSQRGKGTRVVATLPRPSGTE